MYSGHAHLSVCVFCLSLAAFPHYCTDPDLTLENGRGCPQSSTIEWICNWCMGFVAMTTQRERKMSAGALYSLCAITSMVKMACVCACDYYFYGKMSKYIIGSQGDAQLWSTDFKFALYR